jgi:hypothetical protein
MKILINLFYRKKTHGGRMKSIKYLLTAILMVSTGLSAMDVYDPAGDFGRNKVLNFNQSTVSAKVQFAKDVGSTEAYLMAQPISVPNEQGQLKNIQLPPNIAQQIGKYIEAEKKPVREQEKRYNEFLKHTNRPLHLLLASIPMLAAGLLGQNSKCWLAGSALLTSGLIWYGRADFNHNCHCTFDCYHARNNSIVGNLVLGLTGSCYATIPSALLYPAAVGLIAKAEYGFKSEKSTGFFFGIKAASVPLVPLFAQRLLEGEGRQWVNAGMLATAAFASYSGFKDLIAYKRSHFKSFEAFLMGRDSMQFEEETRERGNQNIFDV